MNDSHPNSSRDRLLEILKAKSVFFGDFTLASGAKSTFYIDCRLTTLDGEGATLIGEILAPMIREKAQELGVDMSGVGGLTLGADPISLATAMASHRAVDRNHYLGNRCHLSHRDRRLRVQPGAGAALHLHRVGRGKHRSGPSDVLHHPRLAAVRPGAHRV